MPARLRHLFWNTAPEQLDTDRHGSYIARRLLTAGSVDGLAWGSVHLSAADWQKASRARGLSEADRVLAKNIARSAG